MAEQCQIGTEGERDGEDRQEHKTEGHLFSTNASNHDNNKG